MRTDKIDACMLVGRSAAKQPVTRVLDGALLVLSSTIATATLCAFGAGAANQRLGLMLSVCGLTAVLQSSVKSRLLAVVFAGMAVANAVVAAWVPDPPVAVSATQALSIVAFTVAVLLVTRGLIVAAGTLTALLTLATVLALLVAMSLVLERLPGQRMSHGGATQTKGTVPHRTLGQSYFPNSRARTFYADHPRGYFDESNPRDREFSLRIADLGNVATLATRPDGVLRIEIGRTIESAPWKIQLIRRPHPVNAGVDYEIAFRARADAKRSIGVSVTQAHEPWDGLGHSREFQVDTTWRAYSDVFRDSQPATIPR